MTKRFEMPDGPTPPSPHQVPLSRVRNVRDLGGYEYRAEDGTSGVTACGALLRGPSLQKLRQPDFELLRSYGAGLKCVIDLRSDFETRHWPDPYARGRDGVTYVHVPMLDRLGSEKLRDSLPDRMFTVYRNLLENDGQSIRRVMEAIDFCGSGGCTLFHCRAGKDRTGVIAMLLLGLAGVSDEDILADYVETQRHLGRGLRVKRHIVSLLLRRRAPRCLFEAIPSEMELTLDHLHGRYGTARNYLESIGVSPVTSDRLACLLRQGRAAPLETRGEGHRRDVGQGAPETR